MFLPNLHPRFQPSCSSQAEFGSNSYICNIQDAHDFCWAPCLLLSVSAFCRIFLKMSLSKLLQKCKHISVDHGSKAVVEVNTLILGIGAYVCMLPNVGKAPLDVSPV